MKTYFLMLLQSALVLFLVSAGSSPLLAGVAPPSHQPMGQGPMDDGIPPEERVEVEGLSTVSSKAGSRAGTGPDMVIVDPTRRIAFFGLYRASQMAAPGWDLYERTVNWANSFNPPATTTVWLATYNGTLDPTDPHEADSLAVYDYLVGTMGFLPANIHIEHQSHIETADFTGYDLVIYSRSYPWDATNVVTQGKPYVTMSAGQTDELNIGTGVKVMHESRDYMFVIENLHHITSPYPLGRTTLVDPMWMDATVLAGNGRLLIKAEVQTLETGKVTLSAATGGSNHLYLDAGPGHGFRTFAVLGSVSGSAPGTLLPGGLVLPINWDFFTDMVVAGFVIFPSWLGVLDVNGINYRHSSLPPLPGSAIGLTITYAYCLYAPYNFVSNPVDIDIVP